MDTMGTYVTNNKRMLETDGKYIDLMLCRYTGDVMGIQPTAYERKDTWLPEGSPLFCWSANQSSNPDVSAVFELAVSMVWVPQCPTCGAIKIALTAIKGTSPIDL